MNKYKVTEQVTITIEVEASNEDEARMKAMATLPDYKTWELEASEGINVERIYDRLWYYKFEGKKFEYFEEVDACCEGDLSYLEGPFDTFLDAKAAAWKRFRRFSRATNLAERCALLGFTQTGECKVMIDGCRIVRLEDALHASL